MMSNVNVQTANVHTGNWTKDADGEWILLTDHGAVAAVWPEVNSKPARWRATVWGSGTMRAPWHIPRLAP